MESSPTPRENSSFMTTAMLNLFLGWLGADRFYLNKVGTAVLKLMTFGGGGLWVIVDQVLILSGYTKDKNGQPLTNRDKYLSAATLITLAVIIIMVFSAVQSSNQYR